MLLEINNTFVARAGGRPTCTKNYDFRNQQHFCCESRRQACLY